MKINTVYVDCKELPIVGALEPGMTAGDWDWEECPAPTEVRGYLKDTLLKLVKVHAEVLHLVVSLSLLGFILKMNHKRQSLALFACVSVCLHLYV